MIVKTCRYFGFAPEYWEDRLTLRWHRAHENELALRPPAEMFLAAYFQAQRWWRPPSDSADHDREALSESDLPEFE